MEFKKIILLLIGETTLNMMITESIQLKKNINDLHKKGDDICDKECNLIHEILQEIADGDIKSSHIDQKKAKIYLKIIDDVLDGKAQIHSPFPNTF